MSKLTKEQLNEITRDAILDGTAFPFLVTHCPRAVALLDNLIEAGQKTHGPMDWKDLDISGNTNRARIHSNRIDMTAGINIQAHDVEDHLLNATCRLLMALELREEAKDKKS